MSSIKNPAIPGMAPLKTEVRHFVVFDWANLVRRAYHSTENSKVLELVGFMLAKQRVAFPRSKFVFALEGRGRAFRARIYPEYKGNRTPDAAFDRTFAQSIEMLDFIDGIQIKAPDGEADDAIASFVEHRKRYDRIVIISEDRDLWQLIHGDSVKVHAPRKNETIDTAKCKELLGVPPKNVACLKSFLGDSGDNVPRGVPRMRTASLLLLAAAATTPADAYKKARKEQLLPAKQLDRVVKYKEQIQLNYRLVQLRPGLRTLRRTRKADPSGMMSFLREHGMYRITVDTVTRITGA
jgi:hypothetical protein